MADLRILGPVELKGDEGRLEHSFLAGPKRLALLTFLVLNRPRGLQRRDRILPLLWPDKGQKSARNLLSNLLYHIRKSLGGDIIEARGTEEIGINYDRLKCDALDFEKALNEDKTEIAVELYRGNLLEGFYVGNTSPGFEQWLDRERERFRNKFREALEILALHSVNAGNLKKASEYWEMQIQADPFDTSAVKKTISLLTALGKRGEALKKAESHAVLLSKELDLDRDKLLDELISELDQEAEKIKAPDPKKGKASSTNNFKSVAILPLEEFGDNEHIEIFASGLHYDLLTRLSAVSDLTVISRTSVLRYRKTRKTISAIANEIGAGSIVEGSVQIIGDRVRLNIQLIDIGNDYHIWSDTYDRKLTAKHLFDIQSELALKITEGLRAKLMPVEKNRIADWAPTNDLEAHRLYTYGRRQVDQRTESGMKRAVEYFQEAVQKDPGYAQAWAGLADTLILQHDYGYKNAKIILPKAEKAISRALELDPNLAEAHASMGLLYSNLHKGGAAIRKLKKAVELQPSYAEAHNWLSWNYQLLGDAVNALESAKIAVNLNPLSPESVSNLSASYLYNGYPEKSQDEALRGMELHPEWNTLAFYDALALMELNRVEEAKLKLENLSVPWAGNGPLATLALCHILLDENDKAEQIAKTLNEKGDTFAIGLIRAAFGDYTHSIEHFYQVEFWDDWESLTIHHLYPEILEPIRKHPRFHDLKKRVEKSRGKV
jgi:TolB-like protein